MKKSRHFVLILCLLLAGCSGGKWSVKKGDQIVDGDPETMAGVQKAKAYEQDRMRRLASAEKRAPNDPITVAVFNVVAQKPFRAGQMSSFFQKQFDGHPVIRRHDQGRVNDFEQKNQKKSNFSAFKKVGLFVDVTVKTQAGGEQFVGYNKKTKKVGKGTAFVIQSIIESPITKQTFKVKERASLFDNQAAVARLAKKVRWVILKKIGPQLPKSRMEYFPGSEDGSKPTIDYRDLSSDQKMDVLKGVFQKFRDR